MVFNCTFGLDVEGEHFGTGVLKDLDPLLGLADHQVAVLCNQVSKQRQ